MRPLVQRRRHALLVASHHAADGGAAAREADGLELLAAPVPGAPLDAGEAPGRAAGQMPVQDLPARVQRVLLDLEPAPRVSEYTLLLLGGRRHASSLDDGEGHQERREE